MPVPARRGCSFRITLREQDRIACCELHPEEANGAETAQSAAIQPHRVHARDALRRQGPAAAEGQGR